MPLFKSSKKAVTMVSVDEFWLACRDGDLVTVKLWLTGRCTRVPSVDAVNYDEATREFLLAINKDATGWSHPGALLAAIRGQNLPALELLMTFKGLRGRVVEEKDLFIDEATATGNARILEYIKFVQRASVSRWRSCFCLGSA